MEITDRTACESVVEDKKLSIEYNGVKLYFCEKECIEEFQENPQKFLHSDHFKLDLTMLHEKQSNLPKNN